jgi:hypothetical protein
MHGSRPVLVARVAPLNTRWAVAAAERARNIIGQLRGAARAKEFWAATNLRLSGGLRNVD